MNKKHENTHKKASCIEFKLSKEEFEIVQKKANEAGVSFNTYVKNKILQKPISKTTNIH